MNRLLIFLFIAQPFLAWAQTPNLNVSPSNELTFKVFLKVDKTYGYNIYKNGKLFIHQLSIPGRAGTSGFKTKQNAETVAKLVISKIKKGIIPPTVEENDLKRLNI